MRIVHEDAAGSSRDIHLRGFGAHDPAHAQQTIEHLGFPVRKLGRRQIHDPRGGLVEPGLLDIARHANDFANGIFKVRTHRGADVNVLPDGVLPFEIGANKLLVHDHNRRGGVAVRLGE